MTGSGAPVLTTVEEGIAWLTLNRPDKRNALDEGVISALKEALAAAEADAGVRLVAVRGAGSDFCSGADLAAVRRIADADVMENLRDVDSLADLFLQLRRLRKPVVAVVHGRALAGGAGLATACDLVLAGEGARFGYPEVRVGFVPAMVMAILRRNVSEKRAFELIVGGETLDAAEAERIGLVNRVFPDATLAEESRAYLGRLAAGSGSAAELCKRLLYHQDGMGFEAAIRAGADVNALARMTADTRAGIDRFLSRSREGADAPPPPR